MTYDYRCGTCNTEVSTERSIHSEASNPTCSECHEPMNRVYAVGAVTFVGKGFYKNGG